MKAIQQAAAEQGIRLPAMTAQGMGSLMLRITCCDRQVFLKRRLVPSDDAEKNGVEWSVWQQENDHPELVASFREVGPI